jgi:hypothetical protein
MFRRPATLALVAALALAASGCLTAGDRLVAHEYGPPLLPTPSLGSMHNVSVRETVWTGSHPTPEDLDIADRRGIGRALDISLPEEQLGFDVGETCERLGMEYVRLQRGSAGRIPDDEAVDELLEELRRANVPTLLFSGNGDRAAMVCAVWRVVECGIPVDEAIDEARRSGMKPGAPVAFVRAQVARLSAGS